MKKLHYSIVINAPRETVFKTMLQDATYREWTAAFSPGGYYEGDWSEGSTMKFIGPNPDNPEEGKNSGMIMRVAKYVPNEFVSLEAVGYIIEGVEDFNSQEVKEWQGALENYTFTDVDGGTEVRVDQDTHDDFVDQFSRMWPKGLAKLKEICER
jgi:uncharacterized protein YndB with AHSA1/START domain